MNLTGLKNNIRAVLDTVADKVERPLWYARNCVVLLVVVIGIVLVAVAVASLIAYLGLLLWLAGSWAFAEIPIVAWSVTGALLAELTFRWSRRRNDRNNVRWKD